MNRSRHQTSVHRCVDVVVSLGGGIALALLPAPPDLPLSMLAASALGAALRRAPVRIGILLTAPELAIALARSGSGFQIAITMLAASFATAFCALWALAGAGVGRAVLAHHSAR